MYTPFFRPESGSAATAAIRRSVKSRRSAGTTKCSPISSARSMMSAMTVAGANRAWCICPSYAATTRAAYCHRTASVSSRDVGSTPSRVPCSATIRPAYA